MPDKQPLFRVDVEKEVNKRLGKLHTKHQKQVLSRIADLEDNPRPQDSIQLKGYKDFRINVGGYRILYEIDYTVKLVRVWKLMDRKEGYRRL